MYCLPSFCSHTKPYCWYWSTALAEHSWPACRHLALPLIVADTLLPEQLPCVALPVPLDDWPDAWCEAWRELRDDEDVDVEVSVSVEVSVAMEVAVEVSVAVDVSVARALGVRTVVLVCTAVELWVELFDFDPQPVRATAQPATTVVARSA